MDNCSSHSPFSITKISLQRPRPLEGYFCGAGGIRTRVRTRGPYAFYMLIPAFDFRATARPGPPTAALSPQNSPAVRGRGGLFPIYLHRLTFGFGTTSSERCLVASPGDAIKPVTYCTSVRQRERNCFRQLIFVHSDSRASQRGSACLHTISSCRQVHTTP